MNALGKNPAAAQNFFSGGDTRTVSIDGTGRVVSDRLAYLVQDRTWAVDPTNGGSLGSALGAATATLRNRTSTGRTSAEIASQTFALIGDKTGDGKDGGFIGLGADDGWKMWDGMRPSVANMLASYGADVYRAGIDGADEFGAQGWSMPGSGVLFGDDMPYGATVDKDLVERIIGTLGEDQDNFTPFLAGMYQASNLAMDTGLKRAMLEQTLDNAGGQFLTGGALIVTHPKTAKSRRVLPLASPEIRMLQAQRHAQDREREHAGEMWHEDGFVFTSKTGRPMDPRNVLRALTTAARKSGIEHATVHTLRHSAATAWLEAGINIKAVSTLLGHADIRITADVYGHVSDEVAHAAMGALSFLLRVHEDPTDPNVNP